MPLRSEKEYLKEYCKNEYRKKEYLKEYLKVVFPKETEPFNMILLSEKIDFDEASREWRKNKIHLGEGMFKYKRNR